MLVVFDAVVKVPDIRCHLLSENVMLPLTLPVLVAPNVIIVPDTPTIVVPAVIPPPDTTDMPTYNFTVPSMLPTDPKLVIV